jgi:serine/threonine protein kinase
MTDPEYRIIELIGMSAGGLVFLAEAKSGLRVAIKTVGTLADGDTRYLEREFDVLSTLSHPHIVRVYDKFLLDGRLHFAMEFVNGTSLDQFLDQHRSVIDADVARVFLQLLDALDYLHSKRFVHGEVSPRNILVSESGDVRLLDFEHCRRLDEAEPELWPSGTIAGIPIYMAPEQMRGEELHAEADYFVVGLLLLEHVRGQHPLKRSQGFVQLWTAIAQPNEEAVAEWLHDLKSPLMELLRELLSPRWERRRRGWTNLRAFLGTI